MSQFRIRNTLDWLLLTIVLVTLAIHFTGGFAWRIGRVELVSLRSQGRGVLLTLLLIAARIALRGNDEPPTMLQRLWRRLYDRRADSPADSTGRSRWPPRLLALVGFSAFGAVLLYPQLRHMDWLPEFGDPLFSIWRIAWVYHQLVGDPRPLFDANIFYPYHLTLAYSDSMLLPAVITAPLLAAGVPPVVAVNVVLVGSFLASALAAYLLVEHLTGSAGAAFVSGLLFGFYPYHWDHYTHFELLMAFWIPLSLLEIHRFVETGKLRHAMLAALFAVAQLYSSMYLAAQFMWQAGAVVLLLSVLQRRSVLRLAGPLAIAAILAAVLALPLARTYTSARLDERPVEEVTRYSATPGDYLHAHQRSVFWRGRTLGNASPERALFPGAMALLLAAVALIPPLGLARLVYVGALLTAFEISLGTNGSLYPVLYDWLPFMRGMRAAARASILVGLGLAVLSGFTVQRWLAWRGRWTAMGLLAAMTLAIGVDLRPEIVLEPAWRSPPPIYEALSGKKDVVLAEFPMGFSAQARFTDTPQMYFSLWHWHPLVNGYSGNVPRDHFEFLDSLRSFPDESSIRSLRTRGATHVTVNCRLYSKGCEEMLLRLDSFPDLRFLASVRWEGKPVRLYELTH